MSDEELMEILHKCQEGRIVKFVGAGLVILNYDWWKKILEKQGKEIGDDHFFKPVPDCNDLKED